MARYPAKPLRRNRATVRPSLSPDLQYRLLRVTRGCPGRRWTTADELAVKLRIAHGTLAAALFECAASGFLRPANGSLRRRLSLTGAGRRRLDQLEQYRQAEILALQNQLPLPRLMAREGARPPSHLEKVHVQTTPRNPTAANGPAGSTGGRLAQEPA